MTAFSGDSIALTFTADLAQARASYDQFIADVARRPIPIQFQSGGAAASVGASIPNAPGLGGAGQWATGATASAAALSGRGIIQGPGVAAQALQPAAGAGAGQTINAGNVTINAGTVTLAGGAAGAAEGAAAGGEDAPGVGGARRRGGGGFGFGSNRMIFALSLAAAAHVAHTEDALEDAQFATAHSSSLAQYYGNQANEWKAVFSGPAGFISRFVLDRTTGQGSRYAPTAHIQGFEEQAFNAQSDVFQENLQEHITGQRMRRLGYSQGYATGGAYGARAGETIAGIRAAAHAERTGFEREIRERQEINADLQSRANLTPAEARAITQRNVEIGALRQGVRENETTEQAKVLQFQQEQRRTQASIAISVGNRGYSAYLRSQGRIGEARDADFEGGLSELRRQHETDSSAVQTRVEQAIRDERAARDEEGAYRIGQTNLTAQAIEFQIARNPLQARLARIGSDYWEAMRNAAPDEHDSVQREFGARRELAKQQDADERLSARGRLNVENAGLAILANGPGTYAERQTAAAASDIYGQTLLASLAAVQQGRPELLGGLKRRGQLQLQSLQQQMLAGFRAEEVDLNRVAVSNPQDSLQQIGKIVDAVTKIPGQLDDIEKALTDFDKVQ